MVQFAFRPCRMRFSIDSIQSHIKLCVTLFSAILQARGAFFPSFSSSCFVSRRARWSDNKEFVFSFLFFLSKNHLQRRPSIISSTTESQRFSFHSMKINFHFAVPLRLPLPFHSDSLVNFSHFAFL